MSRQPGLNRNFARLGAITESDLNADANRNAVANVNANGDAHSNPNSDADASTVAARWLSYGCNYFSR